MPSRSLLTRKEEKLFHYIKRGNYEKFTHLLSERQNLDILSIVKKHGNTLLHYSCKYNSSPILLYLLKRVKDIDIKNDKGENALQIATKYKNVELCKILLSKGADFRITNKEGKCALDYGLDKIVDLSPYLPHEESIDEEYNPFIYDSDEEGNENSDWFFEENYDSYNTCRNKNEFKRKILTEWEEEMRRIEEEKRERKIIEKIKYNNESKAINDTMNIYKNIQKNNEMRWLKFINSSPKYLRIENIPFPRGVSSDEKNILGISKVMNRKEIKKIIYENQIRWHPDKFERRFNDLLNEENREEIMNKVKETSQIINKLKSDYLK